MSVVEFRPRIPGAPRRGEIYGWEGRKLLILSNDHYNESRDPLCVLIVRTAPHSEYVVTLADADPFGGRVVIGPLFPMARTELGEPKGTVTGATLAKVTTAMHLLFGDD